MTIQPHFVKCCRDFITNRNDWAIPIDGEVNITLRDFMHFEDGIVTPSTPIDELRLLWSDLRTLVEPKIMLWVLDGLRWSKLSWHYLTTLLISSLTFVEALFIPEGEELRYSWRSSVYLIISQWWTTAVMSWKYNEKSKGRRTLDGISVQRDMRRKFLSPDNDREHRIITNLVRLLRNTSVLIFVAAVHD